MVKVTPVPEWDGGFLFGNVFLPGLDRGAFMHMKCIQVVEIGSFIKTEMPVKRPSADEAVIKIEVTGLCRTDLKLIRVGHRDLVLPRVPAEEVVGTIWQKGERVTGIERNSYNDNI